MAATLLTADPSPEKNATLVALGERVRSLRSGRGLTRKALAGAADVSERHLANLEHGVGNASILILVDIARALQCSVAELLADDRFLSPEWMLIRALLEQQDEAGLQRVRLAIAASLGALPSESAREGRVALMGLRGAGKSTLGKRLAEELGLPFVELSKRIEDLAGGDAGQIQALYGINAYRRYERRAIEAVIEENSAAIIAVPGGIVSDASTLNLLLARCHTVWLQASPKDHLQRVMAQGDLRPMAASKEALDDLKGILNSRAPYYSKAEATLNTSEFDVASTQNALRKLCTPWIEKQQHNA